MDCNYQIKKNKSFIIIINRCRKSSKKENQQRLQKNYRRKQLNRYGSHLLQTLKIRQINQQKKIISTQKITKPISLSPKMASSFQKNGILIKQKQKSRLLPIKNGS